MRRSTTFSIACSNLTPYRDYRQEKESNMACAKKSLIDGVQIMRHTEGRCRSPIYRGTDIYSARGGAKPRGMCSSSLSLLIHPSHHPPHQPDRHLAGKEPLHQHVCQAISPAWNNDRLLPESCKCFGSNFPGRHRCT